MIRRRQKIWALGGWQFRDRRELQFKRKSEGYGHGSVRSASRRRPICSLLGVCGAVGVYIDYGNALLFLSLCLAQAPHATAQGRFR